MSRAAWVLGGGTGGAGPRNAPGRPLTWAARRPHFLPPPRPFHIPAPPAPRPPLRSPRPCLPPSVPPRPAMKAAQASGEEAPGGARSVKVVLVGDGGCGKTSLLMVFAEGAFPEVSEASSAPPAHPRREGWAPVLPPRRAWGPRQLSPCPQE